MGYLLPEEHRACEVRVVAIGVWATAVPEEVLHSSSSAQELRRASPNYETLAHSQPTRGHPYKSQKITRTSRPVQPRSKVKWIIENPPRSITHGNHRLGVGVC